MSGVCLTCNAPVEDEEKDLCSNCDAEETSEEETEPSTEDMVSEA